MGGTLPAISITMGPTLWDVSVYLYNDVGFPESCGDHHPFGVPGKPPKQMETSDHLDVFLIFFRFKQMLVVHNYRFSDTYSMRWCSSIQRFRLINRSLCMVPWWLKSYVKCIGHLPPQFLHRLVDFLERPKGSIILNGFP